MFLEFEKGNYINGVPFLINTKLKQVSYTISHVNQAIYFAPHKKIVPNNLEVIIINDILFSKV